LSLRIETILILTNQEGVRQMDKIFTTIRHWIARLLETGATPDATDGLSIRDYADLPRTRPASRVG
jgi:hypothetical protein